MPNIFPQLVKVHPSFTEPELILTYAQATGAFEVLPEGKPTVKIGNSDLAVYIHSLDLRTQAQAGQASGNYLPSATLIANYFQTLTYLARVRAEWDHHDIAAASNWGVGLVAAQDLAMKQGIYQIMRTALLYGFNPTNNEGLLNAQGATKVTLPPDTQGNLTLRTYNNADMFLFLLNQVVALKSAMYQSGGKINNRVVVVSPQRVFLTLQMAAVIDVVSFQRPGAGTDTVAEAVQKVLKEAGDTIEWYFDDTLIGMGPASSADDCVIVTIPEIEQPTVAGINTNAFADLMPHKKAVNAMYADMAAPMKIPTPIPDGAITEVQELRITSGWNLRPQGLMLISMPY
jgi:hypothetical protein